MQLDDGHATLVATNLGGPSKAPNFTITLKFETELADQGPVGRAFIEGWPLLESAIGDVQPDEAEGINASAPALFGAEAHVLRLWGMARERRTEYSTPILVCREVHLSGKVSAEVKRTAGEPALVTVRMALKAPAKAWDKVLMQDVAGQLHGQCWVDLEPTQADVEDPVTPTVRKPGGGAQGGLQLVDGGEG